MPPMYICKNCGEDVGYFGIFCEECLKGQPDEVKIKQEIYISERDRERAKCDAT